MGIKNFFKKRKGNSIRDSLQNQKVHFSYPRDLSDFNYLFENFMQIKASYVDSDMGELSIVNRLIVLDDVSGLVDKSEQFSNFLTVTRNHYLSR